MVLRLGWDLGASVGMLGLSGRFEDGASRNNQKSHCLTYVPHVSGAVAADGNQILQKVIKSDSCFLYGFWKWERMAVTKTEKC